MALDCFCICHLYLPHLGVMPMKNSKLMPGMGRDSTDKYSSLKRLLMAAFNEMSAQAGEHLFSSVTLLMKYDGSLPVSDMSFDDIVKRSL
jgi:hypothetical protein